MRRSTRWLLYAGVLSLVVSSIYAGAPPKAGWRKADLVAYASATATPPFTTLPDATVAAQLAAAVPFDILESYDRSLLISVAIDNLDRLRALEKYVFMDFTEHDNYDTLQTAAGVIDTRYPISLPTGGLPNAVYAAGEWGTYLIQFHGPMKASWIPAIAGAGAVPLVSERTNGYVIAATPEIVVELLRLPFVQWATALHPYLKHVPDDRDFVQGRVNAIIDFIQTPATEDAVRRVLEKTGGYAYFYQGTPAASITVALTREQFADIVREPLVDGIWTNYIGSGGGGGGGGGGTPAQIPTLSTVALLFLGLAMIAVAMRR